MTSKIVKNYTHKKEQFQEGMLYTTENGTVVLCTRSSEGSNPDLVGVAVVTPPHGAGLPVGHFDTSWDAAQFTRFSGTIELSQ